jgi:hypothetical protein
MRTMIGHCPQSRVPVFTDYPTLVCLDETSKQLLAETRVPIPMKPGRPAHCDYEYERNGTANLFMMFAPLEGWRRVKVTDRQTAVEYAHVLNDLADVHFANAKASNGTTLPNMAVGSIWPSPNSASCRPSASIAASPTNKPSSTKLPLGSTIEMPTTPRPTGTSQPPMHGSNSSTFTLQSE